MPLKYLDTITKSCGQDTEVYMKTLSSYSIVILKRSEGFQGCLIITWENNISNGYKELMVTGVNKNPKKFANCTSYSDQRKILPDGIIDLIGSISNLHDTKLVNILIFGDDTFSIDTNLSILKLTS